MVKTLSVRLVATGQIGLVIRATGAGRRRRYYVKLVDGTTVKVAPAETETVPDDTE